MRRSYSTSSRTPATAPTSRAWRTSSIEGDICDAVVVAHAGEGCDAVVNFAAETHVDRSILERGRVHRDRRARHVRPPALGARARCTARPGVDRRGVRRRRGAAPLARGRTASPIEPVLGLEGGRRHAGAGGGAHVTASTRASHAARTRTARTSIRRSSSRSSSPTRSTALELPVYGDGRQVREWLHVADHAAAVDLVLREGTTGEVVQRRRRGAREPRRHAAHRPADGLRPGARPARRRPSRPRPPLRARRREAPRARLGARRARSTKAWPRRSSGTGRTAPGGSRSSPVNTGRTTSSSTLPA